MKRRNFLAGTGALMSYGLSQQAAGASTSPNEKISVAAIGLRGRGNAVLRSFVAQKDVDIRYVVDVDESVRLQRTSELEKLGRPKPLAVEDFRRVLDDKQVDAIMLGTPTHWHAIPTILACQAGKDVYCEKPDAHNITEGQLMVAAAKKHKRVIQLGTQSRSGKHFLDAIEYISKGHLGKVLFAKAWESAKQGSLGKPADRKPPSGVNYDLWLGPAPERPFNPLRFHGNWRWFFDYGAGDLGNDGVHRLDIARWAFETALKANGETPLGPVKKVSAFGDKCYFDDLQEWPDNLMCTYDFGKGRILTYEMRIWSPYRMMGDSEGAAVFGDQGYVIIGNGFWKAFAARDKLVRDEKGSYDNTNDHVRDFLDCMKTRNKPVADLETVGHPSSLLCHLGNASWRAGRSLEFDYEKYEFKNDPDANQFLTRPKYREPWKLPKLGEL